MPDIVVLPDQRAGQKETLTITPDLGGETISSVEWDADGVAVSGENNSGNQATAFIRSDSPGVFHPTCWVTTSAGRRVPFVFKLTVKELHAE